MLTKAQMFRELSTMLRDVFSQQQAGGTYQKLMRAQGNVDGYMRAMLDSGAATKEELLRLVAAERTVVRGPATRDLTLDDATEAAA